MTKNGIRGITVLAILLAVFSVIAFMIPFERTAVFWTAYLCGVATILFQLYIFRLSAGRNADARSRFYDFPIVRLGIIHLAVQLVVSIAEISLAKFLPFWTVLIVNMIILAAALIGCITKEIAREEVMRLDEKQNRTISNMRELQAISSGLPEKSKDPGMKKTLEKLAEEFRYSDPRGSNTTDELEAKMLDGLKELQSAVLEQKTEKARDLCEKLTLDLSERNRICRINKK